MSNVELNVQLIIFEFVEEIKECVRDSDMINQLGESEIIFSMKFLDFFFMVELIQFGEGMSFVLVNIL